MVDHKKQNEAGLSNMTKSQLIEEILRLRELPSKQKHTEQNNENILYLQAIGEQAPFACAIFEENGDLIQCNQKYRDLYAYSESETNPGINIDELVKLNLAKGTISEEYLNQWDYGSLIEYWKNNLNAQISLELSNNKWIRIINYICENIGVVSIHIDITDIKSKELQVKQSEKLFLDAIQKLPEGIILFDENDYMVICNEAYKNIYPHLREYLNKGCHFNDLLNWHIKSQTFFDETMDADAYYQRRRQMFSEADGEVYIEQSPDGRWIQNKKLCINGGATIGICVDITNLKETEQSLKDQENFLKTVINSTPTAINIRDAEGRLVLVNKVWASYYDTPEESVVGLHPREIVPESLRNSIEQDEFDAAVLSGKAVLNEEYRYDYKDHSEYYLVSRIPLVSATGKVNYVVTTGYDITKLRRAEIALQKSEELSKQAEKIAKVGHWTWSLVDDKCTYCSEGCAAMFGLSRKEFIEESQNHLSTTQRIFPDDVARYTEEIDHAEQNLSEYTIEYRILSKNKDVRYIIEKGKIKRDIEGNALHSIGTLQDVTEKMLLSLEVDKAREAAVEAESLLSDAIDNISEGFALFDNQHCMILANDMYRDQYGYTKADTQKGTSVLTLLNKDRKVYEEIGDHEGVNKTRKRMASFGKSKEAHEMLLPDGRLIQVRDRHTTNGGIVSIHADVTRRKKIEERLQDAINQAEKAMEMKSEFVAVVSHEVRTPMNGVLGMARLLRETSLDEEQIDGVDTVISSGEALLRILDDLLDVSKLDAGRLELESKPFNMSNLIHQIVKLMASNAQESGLELIEQVDQEIPAVLIGDAHRLRQILLNLISNAIKFTEHGSVTVSVNLDHLADDTAELQFTVKDTGQGISKSAQDKLFSQYAQGSVEVARKYGGTGLGLVICRRLVEMMGGNISLKSAMGQGSEFGFTLSLKVDRKTNINLVLDQDPKEKNLTYNGQKTSGNLSVLIVEDDPTNQKVASKILYKRGYEVSIVENGEEALDKMGEEDFDIVLMDRHMPIMNGIEATKQIRKMPSPKCDIPIIGITAGALKSELQSCLDAGMNRVMTKPVDSELLLSLTAELTFRNSKSEGLNLSAPVLVIEDNLVNQKVISKSLDRLEVKYELASNGIDALIQTRQRDFSLILTDLHMPEMDGMTFVEKFRAESRSPNTPIIALTAHVTDAERQQLQLLDIKDILIKPVENQKLKEMIVKWAVDVAVGSETALPYQSSEEPSLPINMNLLAKIMGTDEKEELDEMLQLFLTVFPEYLEKINKFISTQDREKTKIAAHGARGAANNIAAINLSEKLGFLEERSDTIGWQEIKDVSISLSEEFEQIRRFILN